MEIEEILMKVREKFMKVFEENPDLFDNQDVKRVKEDDWTIKRYLLHKCFDEESALQMLIDSMKWRKEFGISQIRDSYFPREFYACGAIFSYCNDKDGHKTLYLRIKMVKKMPEMTIFLKKFLVHNINKVDQQSNGKGWALIIDASEAGISNCDIDLLFFLINTLKNYFPAVLRYILVHEVGWALQGIWKVAKAWIPGERIKLIKFSTNKDITDYIDTNALPDFLGGNAKRDYKIVPDGCPDALTFGTEVAKIPVERVLKIVECYKPFLSESHK